MQTGWTSRFALAFALVSVASSLGCATTATPAPVAPTVAETSETSTTSAIVLGAPVTLADGPRTTIPNDPPR